MKISVIGLGLIGGSYTLSLKKRFEDVEAAARNGKLVRTTDSFQDLAERCPSFYKQ